MSEMKYKQYKNKKRKKSKYTKLVQSKPKFIEILIKIKSILSHKLYFMFIPHSKKKTKSVSIPIYLLLIIVTIILTILLSTFSFLTKNTVLASKTEILTGSYNDKLKEINNLEELFNSVATNDIYRQDMSNIMVGLKIKNDDNILTNEYIDNLMLINSRAYEFEKLKIYLDELKANINSKQNSLEHIPSILPIDSRYAIISIPYQPKSILSSGVGFETIAGTIVRATATGVVTSVTYNQRDGFTIEISHRFGVTTKYKGLATSTVAKNRNLKKGEIIGSARTGVLEYELKIAASYVDPLIFTTANYGK